MTVPDIIKKVFADQPAADFAFELTSSYHKWTYCVQYRETDFNFVSRLMEEEGMYYYTRHTEGHNTVVITDSTGKHTPVSTYCTRRCRSSRRSRCTGPSTSASTAGNMHGRSSQARTCTATTTSRSPVST